MTKSNRRAAEVGGAGRWSAKRKADAVLRLLKGEDLDTLSRQLKVTAATLSEWREVFPGEWSGGIEEPRGRRAGRADRGAEEGAG